MAFTLLSSIISMASKLAASIKTSPYSSSTGLTSVKADLEDLERTLQRIQALLNDAEEKEIREESVKLWLKELKGVAYDAEDVLEEYQYELLRAQVESRAAETTHKRKREEDSTEPLQVRDLTPILSDLSIPERIREIRERFDNISKDRKALHLRPEDGQRLLDVSVNNVLLPTSSRVDESGVFGRENDKEKVIEMLLSDVGCELSVIPLVGMGGLGKTTLAQLVYNDPRVRKYFDCRGWTCVSENFDVLKIIRDIVESITRKSCDLAQISVLQDTLEREVNGKKVLVVLDDVWNEKQNLWESLRVSFLGAETVRFLVTTRNDSVANIMRTGPSYSLGLLSEGNDWLLFQQQAFHGRNPLQQPNLVELGKKIVRKCGRLPLAVKVLGGLLRYEMDEDRWNGILESDLWNLDDNKNEILPALRLSYRRMPAHLKQCFLYASVFPKGSKLERDVLVRLWMAHGYIQQKGSKRVEDTGHEYFDELCKRSFFQSLRRRNSDFREDIEVANMHDLIHDLAHSISADSFAITSEDAHKSACVLSGNLLHLYASLEFLQFNKSNPLRTLFMKRCCTFPDDCCCTIANGHLLTNLVRLRALQVGFRELPASVVNLKHLRYLSLNSSCISRLPESICRLYNLQTLDLQQCSPGIELPRCIGDLFNLRHLLLPRDICIRPEIGELINLQVLNRFTVARNNSPCGRLRALKKLNNISGSLQIRGLRNVVQTEEADEASLKYKHLLQRLSLNWDGGECWHCDLNYRDPVGVSATDEHFQDGCKRFHMVVRSQGNLGGISGDEKLAEAVLENLQPHTNLRELIIEDYGGFRFPSWVGDPSFSKLSSVSLIGDTNLCKFLPPLGQLPSLQYLEIKGMHRIELVGREFFCCLSEKTMTTVVGKVGFPSLEELVLKNLPGWEEWGGVMDCDFPRLGKLTIKNCNKLWSLPTLSSLQSLSLTGSYNLAFLSLQKHGYPSKLQFLDIKFCYKLTTLAGLQTLDSLEELCIEGCDKLQFSEYEGLPSNVKTLQIRECKNLKSVTGLQNLSSLKKMEVRKCPQLQMLFEGRLPPNLESIDISDCGKLDLASGLQNLTSLKRLHLERCYKLQLLPDDQLSSRPEHVQIIDCPGATEWCQRQNVACTQEEYCGDKKLMICNIENFAIKTVVADFPFLEHLCFKYCRYCDPEDDLKNLPSTLKTLQFCFSNIWGKVTLHQNLSALQKLTIRSCRNLKEIVGLQHLVSLHHLYICDCKNFQFSIYQQLPSTLRSFVVHGCDELRFLPVLHENLSQLAEINIWNCCVLTSMVGLNKLTSLQTLTVRQCPKLRILTDEHLCYKPHHVSIEDCPGLRKWCQEHGIAYIQRFDCINMERR